MMKRMFLFLCICLGFHLTANADCCKPKNLRVSCSDNDGNVYISWSNDCSPTNKDCIHGYIYPVYTVKITGSISSYYTTGDNDYGGANSMFLPRGGSITVEVECQHGSTMRASCSRASGGAIAKPCPKPLPNVSGYFYTYYVESSRSWKMMCYLSVTNKTGPDTPHTSNCRVWFFTNEELTNSFGDGYSPSGSWEMTIPSSWYGGKIYVKVIPGDYCAPAATGHYWLGQAQTTPGQAGTYYFTWTEVCQ